MSLMKSTFFSSAKAEYPKHASAAARKTLWVSWDTAQNMAEDAPEVDRLLIRARCKRAFLPRTFAGGARRSSWQGGSSRATRCARFVQAWVCRECRNQDGSVRSRPCRLDYLGRQGYSACGQFFLLRRIR